MKKILSMVVLCALLLTALAVSSSAAAYYEQKNPNARITVKKTAGVTIDGIISDGEYEEFVDAAGNYTEWYVAENGSDFFDQAGKMAETVKWYFSWDGGDYFYIAAQWDAEGGANQTMAGGDYYYDRVAEVEDHPDDFLGMGPGLNLTSAELSPADDQWARLFASIGENTATGEKITGMYADQNGQNKDYTPAHSDFEFNYNGNIVTVEYKVPIIELNEKHTTGTPGMFKATILLQAGVYAKDAGFEGGANTYCWGVRLGQHGYNCDSGNTDKVWATFRLVADEIAGPGPVVTDPIVTDPIVTDPIVTDPIVTDPIVTDPVVTDPVVTDPVVTTPGTTTPGATTPGTTTPGTTTPGATTPGTTKPGATTPGTTTPGNGGSANRPTTGNGGNASQTADFGVVAALVSAISAAGVMISKKRR